MSTPRTLRVVVVGETQQCQAIQSVLQSCVATTTAESDVVNPTDVIATTTAAEADETLAARHHLVVGTGPISSPWIDTVVGLPDEAVQLVVDRLEPWASKWRIGRRAPRAQVANLRDDDPTWPESAARLIARIRQATSNDDVERIDHIGSTSVSGLAAKDLIDIQVTVKPSADPLEIAGAVVTAGFVHVAGDWFGKDRFGALHPEQVCVDADPMRPVNINIRSAENPVAREAVLFRDWLRADADRRAEYEALKRSLAGQQIDDYGDRKEPFISAELDRAERWAAQTGWRFIEG